MQNIKESLLNVATAVVAIAAVVMVGVRVQQWLVQPVNAAAKPHTIENWRELSAAGQRIGPQNARVTIVEFMDYQCPFCRQATEDLGRIRTQWPNDVSIVVRQFPIAGHKFAADAAHSAECAAKQGKFESYHDLLFKSQSLIGQQSWEQFAKGAGVPNLALFESCRSSAEIARTVDADTAAGKAAGVLGTPTFIVNDLEIPEYPGQGALVDLVRKQLDAKGH